MKKCGIELCKNKYSCKGYCTTHNYRIKKHGDVNYIRKIQINCTIDGCEKRHFGKGLCIMHYNRNIRFGTPFYDTHRNDGKNILYTTYNSMKNRCYNPNTVNYKNYGGRGITICDRRLGRYGFDNFILDMGSRPKSYTLDRINNNGIYSPENCKWSSRLGQSGNKRNYNNKCMGVGFITKLNKRRAYIAVNKKFISLGNYLLYYDAVKARKDYEYKIMFNLFN